MKLDAGLMLQQLGAVPARVREIERAGYDGVASAEIANDPFLPLVLAAEHSERLELSTTIAVAFARNPMLLAQTAHDLNAWSRGRMILGLGSQIRAHVTRRFSMPWSRPASRMREFIQAMRAIWANWYEGKELAFRGEFYSHTLMTPMFTPAERSFGAPRVFLAAVGPRMTEVLHAFAVVGPWEEVLRGLRARASAGIDRLLCTFDPGSGDAAAERIAALRG